jgi:hypothetical protein
MRMCMQTEESECVGTRGRHGMAWHDMSGFDRWLLACMHICMQAFRFSQPASESDRKVASDTMCLLACFQTDDAAGEME